MCSSSVGTRKKSRFGWLSALHESPVSRHRSRSVVLTWAPQGQHSRKTIHLTLEEKGSLDNKVREWSDGHLSSSASPSEWSSVGSCWLRRCIDDTAKERLPELRKQQSPSTHPHQKSTPFTEMIKEWNLSSSFFFTLFISKGKKRQLLSGGMQERLNWSQPWPGNEQHLWLCCCRQ